MTDSEMRARAIRDLIESKAVRRNLSLKIFDWGEVVPAGGNKVRQEITLRRGLPEDLASKLVKLIRDEFPKVKPQIQGDAIRVAGKIQGRAAERDRPAARAGRGRAAPVRELPLGGSRARSPRVAHDHGRRRAGGDRRPAARHGRDRRAAPTELIELSPLPISQAPAPTDRRQGRTRPTEVDEPTLRTPSPVEPAEPDAPSRTPRRARTPEPEPTLEPTGRARPSPSRPSRSPTAPTPSPPEADEREPEPRAGAASSSPTAVAAGPAGPHDRRRAGRGHAPSRGRPDRVHRRRRELPRHPRRASTAAGIRVVATRHEGAAAFAAEAYGQLTGRPAACLGTRAVGAANLAIGIHTATPDSTPMFVLLGQVDRGLRGREAFQEVDLVAPSAASPSGPGELDGPRRPPPRARGGRAARPSRGDPARSLLSIPEDVQTASCPRARRAGGPAAPRGAHTSDLRAVLHLLAAAERPVILAGAGVLRARCSNDLVRFAEQLHVPVIASWRRGDVIPNDHPLYLGMAGFGSPRTVRERLETADALLVLGSRLNEPTTLRVPVPAMRPALDARRPRAPDGPVGFAAAPERAIRPMPGRSCGPRTRGFGRPSSSPSPSRRATGQQRRGPRGLGGGDGRRRRRLDGPGGPPRPGRSPTLRRLLPEDAIVTTDAGAFGGWAARGFRFQRPGHVPRARPRARWATGSRRRSRPRSCIASGASSRSSATAAWA